MPQLSGNEPILGLNNLWDHIFVSQVDFDFSLCAISPPD
jgi:hypothetical protein